MGWRDWRLWQLLRGAFRPGPGPFDLEEARRRRREAEFELEHARSRWSAIDEAAAAAHLRPTHPDELAHLIELAFQRKAS